MPKRTYSTSSDGSSKYQEESSNSTSHYLDVDEASRLESVTDEEAKERKIRAIESVTKLLNLSETYSKMWSKRFEVLSTVSDKKLQKQRNDMMEKKDDVNYDDAKYFKGSLRPYQVEGVNWMRTLFMGGISGILADEMGLGKTVQVIALLSHLLEHHVLGPHLVIGPLSTLPNWRNEFKRFAPKMPVVTMQGTKEERDQFRFEINRKYKVDDLKVAPVVLMSYQTALKESAFLEKISWKYLVIDEAQRIKNHKSQLAVSVRKLRTQNKLLLTGTPLQNNMTELWALLNFIMPQIFNKVETFSSTFLLEDMEDHKIISDRAENTTIIQTIHRVLAPFMLRRLKKDVLNDLVPKMERLVQCPMSQQQHDLYTDVLKKNITGLIKKKRNEDNDDLNFDNEDLQAPRKKRKCCVNIDYTKIYSYLNNRESSEEFIPTVDESSNDEKLMDLEKSGETETIFHHSVKMQNPMMMFRKIVDHPYLVHMPLKPGTKEILIDDKLITESGKMMVLDAMLGRLHKQGHKVLLFSTLCIMLDLIEEYMIVRDYNYRRLDGSMKLDDRQKCIDEFNKDPDVFVFMLSTRAGGLGLNLTAADTVIFFDRDWNPQVDLQAQDRCHRIGQTKPVMVYTLVTKNTIDEHVIKSGELKRRLERLVIKDGKFRSRDVDDKMDDFSELLKLLEDNKLNTIIHPKDQVFSNKELDNILDRTELYNLQEKL